MSALGRGCNSGKERWFPYSPTRAESTGYSFQYFYLLDFAHFLKGFVAVYSEEHTHSQTTPRGQNTPDHPGKRQCYH